MGRRGRARAAAALAAAVAQLGTAGVQEAAPCFASSRAACRSSFAASSSGREWLRLRPRSCTLEGSRLSRRALPPELLAPDLGWWASEPLVAAQPLPLQAAVVLGILALLAGPSLVLSRALCLSIGVLQAGPAKLGLRAALGLPVAGFFVGIGILHLLLPQDYAGIVPPFGTWGIWPVPGPGIFHAYWTGVAHIVGGVLLLLSELCDTAEWLIGGWALPWRPPPTEQISVFLLLQTVAVAPANVYMFTHGANTLSYLVPLGPIPYPEGHFGAFTGIIFVSGILGALAAVDSSTVRRGPSTSDGCTPYTVSLGALGLLAGLAGAAELLGALRNLV